MSKYVEVTLNGSNGQKTFVHADRIVQFWRPVGQNYTVIEITNGKTISVNETPDDIRNMSIARP